MKEKGKFNCLLYRQSSKCHGYLVLYESISIFEPTILSYLSERVRKERNEFEMREEELGYRGDLKNGRLESLKVVLVLDTAIESCQLARLIYE